MQAKRFNYENKQYLEKLETSGDILHAKYLFYIRKLLSGKNEPFLYVGCGSGRVLKILSDDGYDNVYEIELFRPIIQKIAELTNIDYKLQSKNYRIIADHLKAATFILAENIEPSNVESGYVLRRLIRRAIRYGKQLGIENSFSHKVAEAVIDIYSNIYPELFKNKDFILEQLIKEEERFGKTLDKGLKELEKLVREKYQKPARRSLGEGREKEITGEDAFYLYETFGFPLEMVEEEVARQGLRVDKASFQAAFQKHQDISRIGAEQKFKGGLADHSEKTTKYHTTTHLLLAALRKILGEHVFQKGSNITAERLRFDFSHKEKLFQEQIKQVEDFVNDAIKKDLPVNFEEMTLEQAKKINAMGVFESKYGEKVRVYTIGKGDKIISREICGGPHVKKTSELGRFKIIKEESSGGGVRRIRAVLE